MPGGNIPTGRAAAKEREAARDTNAGGIAPPRYPDQRPAGRLGGVGPQGEPAVQPGRAIV
jgi:hypothetical protein